jgi:RecJ-like exonuclease
MQTHRRPRTSRRRCYGCRALIGVTGNPLTTLCGGCRQRVLDAKAGAARGPERTQLGELQVDCATCAGTGTCDGFAPCDDCAGRGRTPATAAGAPPAAPAREVLPGTGAPPAARPGAAVA